MPGRYSTRRSGNYPRAIVTSIKNVMNSGGGISSTPVESILAKAVNTPLSTVKNDVSNGCIIKAIYVQVDVCGLGGTGVLNIADFYIAKNPGANLTLPAPGAVGTSNEKKFVFKQWRFMIMRNQDGNMPFHWEGWLKIPKRYQRMGTDDTLVFVIACTAAVTGHFSTQYIYKWYR